MLLLHDGSPRDLEARTELAAALPGADVGEPYVERIREAMMPHLFDDQNPPDVRLAELGDLGGAIGASLLVTRERAAVAT